MATAALPENTQNDTTVKLTISLSIIVGLIIIIIVVGWFMSRARPLVMPASARHRQRREGESYRNDTGIFLLDILPDRRYTRRLVPGEQSNGEAQNVTWKTYLLKPFHLMRKGAVHRTIHDEGTALVARPNESPMVNDPDTPNDKLRIPSENDVWQNEGQLESRIESLECSICTEDFVEGENVKTLPCGHIYHRRCIDPWLLDFNSSCPLCRQTLENILLLPVARVRPGQASQNSVAG